MLHNVFPHQPFWSVTFLVIPCLKHVSYTYKCLSHIELHMRHWKTYFNISLWAGGGVQCSIKLDTRCKVGKANTVPYLPSPSTYSDFFKKGQNLSYWRWKLNICNNHAISVPVQLIFEFKFITCKFDDQEFKIRSVSWSQKQIFIGGASRQLRHLY